MTASSMPGHLEQRAAERLEALGLDPVVVGQQDPHDARAYPAPALQSCSRTPASRSTPCARPRRTRGSTVARVRPRAARSPTRAPRSRSAAGWPADAAPPAPSPALTRTTSACGAACFIRVRSHLSWIAVSALAARRRRRAARGRGRPGRPGRRASRRCRIRGPSGRGPAGRAAVPSRPLRGAAEELGVQPVGLVVGVLAVALDERLERARRGRRTRAASLRAQVLRRRARRRGRAATSRNASARSSSARWSRPR